MRHGANHEDRLWRFYSMYNLFAFALVAGANPGGSKSGLGGRRTGDAFLGRCSWALRTRLGRSKQPGSFRFLRLWAHRLRLFGFLVLFWAYRSGVGARPETWEALRAAAPSMSPALLRLSFLLVFVGFGAKTGFAPMHTWLPDAHSEARRPCARCCRGSRRPFPCTSYCAFWASCSRRRERAWGNG